VIQGALPAVRWLRLAVGLAALCAGTHASAQPAPSLVQAWLAFPDLVDVAWPYAYIRADITEQSQKGARQDLLDEFDRLDWRLRDSGYPKLESSVDQWRKALTADDLFRTPGDWSPAFLLSNVNQNPPLAHIAALGACTPPTFVTVWDADGVRRIEWQSSMQISDVERRAPALRKGSAGEIAVIDPYGRIDRYGVQAWNYADGPIAPGSHVIASLPLKGKAFVWIRDAMAELIAHRPSGIDCREQARPTQEDARRG